MADNLRATPQTPGLAALARLLQGTHEFASKPFGYDNPPARLLSELVGLPATARTVERMSYGEPLTTGRGMTARMRPDTEEALMAVAPLAGSAARLAPQAARALAPSAGALALEAAARTGAPVYGMGVIKPKGGNWLAGSVEDTVSGLKSAHIPNPELLRIARENGVAINEEAVGANEALARWTDQKLGKYIKNEMGTPEDPVRALAEQGRLHVDPDQLNFDINAYGKYPSDGQSFLAQNPAAKSWEGASDLHIGKMRADQLLEQGYADKNPWLAKVPPETPVNMMTDPREISSDLGFGHLLDELRNAVNPESGLPRELLWKYSDLDKVTVPQAVERVADINQWRAAQKIAADQARANNAAAVLHKDFPDAPYKWVELKHQEADLPEGYSIQEINGTPYLQNREGQVVEYLDSADAQAAARKTAGRIALEDALKYEGETMGHCVGGYCPDVLEGKSRIFSLRNKKTGEPHVTVEVQPNKFLDFNRWWDEQPKELRDEINARARRGEHGGSIYQSPEYLAARDELPPVIKQIKGKANKAPKEEYLPFVQDFVKSGQWSDVGDLENSGLLQIHPEGGYGRRGSAEHGGVAPGFYTQKELDEAMKSKLGEGFAEGGLVEPPLPAAEFSPLEMDYIIGNVTSAQHEPAYAEGGIVESTHIPYDEAKISSLVNALREELHA